MKTYAEVLKRLRTSQGYQQRDVVRKLNDMGIETAGTQVSRWEHGYNNPNLEQFIGLCRVYSVRDIAATFLDDAYPEPVLNREGQEKLEEYRQLLIDSGRYTVEKPEEERKVLPFSGRRLPVYDLRISAGPGQYADGDSYEMEDVPEDIPENAAFGLVISGNSMEPTLPNGGKIWVRRQDTLENGEIGVFFLDGNLYVKEYRKTEEGVFLVSHNPDYPPKPITEYSTARIYGKVLFPRD